MPFQEYSPFFRPEELDALTAAYNSAWHQLSDKSLAASPEQTYVAKKNLAQIILAAACNGEREPERFKEIAEFAEANSRATVVTLCVVAAISCVVAFAVVCLLRS
jgi:hypothetical protein